MCGRCFGLLFASICLLATVTAVPLKQTTDSEPPKNSDQQNQSHVQQLLHEYYNKFIVPYIQVSSYIEHKSKSTTKYDSLFDEIEKENNTMQSDMAQSDSVVSIDSEGLRIMMPAVNRTQHINFTHISTLLNTTKLENISYDNQKLRQRNTESTVATRAKNGWLDVLKNNVLQRTGRQNDSQGLSPDLLQQIRISLNRSTGLPFIRPPSNIENGTSNFDDYTEKIRSFYPSCGVPRNTDEELWHDIHTMNLFFAVDYTSQQNNDFVNIASATLRLYKLPEEHNNTLQENCPKNENLQFVEDDRLIRVSVYWYSRSLKKNKVIKKKLSDSKMVHLVDKQSSYVELNIRPATKWWVRGRNLGLAVVVEDMDGAVLPTDRYFRGVVCSMVGNVSTPRPIPTFVIDAIRSSNGYRNIINTSYPIANDDNLFMPTVDICTVELPPNLTFSDMDASQYTCKNLKQINPNRNIFGDFKHEKLGTITEILGSSAHHHIRHQRQHHKILDDLDPRSSIVSRTVVMNNSDVGKHDSIVER